MNTKLHHDDHIRKRAGIISLIFAIALFAIKFYAYHLTGSQAIFSDALENIANIITAVAALTVLIISSRPADKDHPYGHGKAEYFASAFEGGAIFFAGLLIVLESINALIRQKQIAELDMGLILVIIAGLFNGLLGLYLQHVGKKYKSSTLVASGSHVISDCLTSIGVVVGLLLVKFTGLVWFDPLVAAIFGAALLVNGSKIVIHSGSELMDAKDMTVVEELARLFEKNYFPGIINLHFMRVMRSGRFHHVNVHIDIPEFWSVEKAHQESEKFEEMVIKEYTFDGEIHFHLDPCRKKFCKMCELDGCPIRADDFTQRNPIDSVGLTSPTA